MIVVIVRKYGFYFLIVAVLSELALPFVLGHFISGYHQTEMLISSFGESGMKTRAAFRIWEVINGFLFLMAAPAFLQRFKQIASFSAVSLSICLVIFGIGDCMITGIISRARTTEEVSLLSLLHNYASGAGFVAMLLGNLLLIYLFYLEKNFRLVSCFFIIFIFSGLFMLLFALPKIPVVNQFQVSHRGLWQRLNLLFLYLPFLIVSLKSITKKKQL